MPRPAAHPGYEAAARGVIRPPRLVRPAPPAILPAPPLPPTPLGLIAASGRLPILVAQGMRALGHPVIGLGLGRQYPEELPDLCDDFETAPLLRLAGWGRSLRRRGVQHAVMVGRIDKASLLYSWWAVLRLLPDARAFRMYRRIWRDLRSHRILAAIADELADDGVMLIDSTHPIPDHMATVGTMTRREPSSHAKRDIEFGWPMLTQLLQLDIGQAIAVRQRDVIAVEAIEGTDRLIERAGDLCRGNPWTLLKGARLGHDRRADVPTVGPATIERLAGAGARCLALAAGDVIMVDKPITLALADQLGIAVVGIPAV
ncbi:MAG: LpxI family protein [Phycisphaerales bacterium]